MEEINPSGAVTDANANNDVAAAEGKENVSDVMSLRDIVKQATGREYTSDEAALEGIKNTYSMVGKVGQAQPTPEAPKAPELPADVLAKLAEVDNLKVAIEQQGFYTEHPEYATPAVKQLISAMGTNPAQVVESEAFKLAFTAITAQNDIEKTKSVLHSSPRLGAATDKMTQAKEQVAAGNTAIAAANAVDAVLEAYELKS